MRLIGLVCLAMVAFAANSVLNRLALSEAAAGPASFAALRLASGAFVLALLVGPRKLQLSEASLWGPLSLLAYVLGFSFAYVTLDAGVGALILFGGVQVTMFAGAVMKRELVPPLRWLGASMALAGLAFLLWPQEDATVSLRGAALMITAAVGWGVYSLLGAGADAPLVLTARNFVLAAPFAVALWLVVPDGLGLRGAALAVVSGSITSALGYAIWYQVLRQIPSSVAAVAQLTVPILALGGGMLILGEQAGWSFAVAASLVLGGVVLSLYRTNSSSGS